jgi:iron complex outermembrane receptor protein
MHPYPGSRRATLGARLRRVFACLQGAAILGTAAIAWAQGADPGVSPPRDAADEDASPGVAPPSDVEVIRIKGRGVAAIETDVPASVTQFDASALEALGAENIADLAKVTPNLEIRTAGSTSATFFIRGVGLSDFSSNAAGAVAIYQDDVMLNAPAIQLGQLFDIENVEVLRGPQGTGSGRNASAGAIKAYARRPTGEYTAQIRSSFGTYLTPDAERALIQDYEGALEAPLVEEMLAARFAFRLRKADPFMTNGCGNAEPFSERTVFNPRPFPGNLSDAQICGEAVSPRQRSSIPEGLDELVGDQGNWAARGQLRFQPPGTEMDWLLNFHGGRLSQQSTLGQAIGTGNNGQRFGETTLNNYWEPDQKEEFDALVANGATGDEARQILARNLAEERPLDIRPYRLDVDKVGQTTLDSWGTSLRGEFAVGPVKVTSVSGFDRYWRFRDTDQDFTPNVLFEAVQTDEAWQFTQELHLSGELADTPLRWETGGYYLMEKLDATVDQNVGNVLGNFNRVYSQDLWSFGVYGGFRWDFLDDFTLEGGVRYNWERKSFFIDQIQTGIRETSQSEETWTAPTGVISLNYRFREDVSAYWKYSRGFKAGHFNSNGACDGFTPSGQCIPVLPADPEYIDAFEAGLRGRWLDGRLALGGALFYYAYEGYQVFVFEDNPQAPPTLEIINANDAEVYGAEVDLRAEPLAGWVPEWMEGLVVTSRFGWLESQFLDFTNTVFRVANTGSILPVTADYSGNQLINSPRFKLSGSAEWTLDLGRWGWIVPRYDFSWSHDVFFDPTEGLGNPNFQGRQVLPEYATGQPAFWLHNLRLAYRAPGGNMELAFWVRNLTDQRYKQYAFDASAFAKVVINFVGEPRTVGLDFSVNW